MTGVAPLRKPESVFGLDEAVRRAFADYELHHSPGCVHQLVPPHDERAERQIVSAMLGGASCDPLTAVDFYVPLHAGVVTALATLREAGKPVPIAVVARGLDALGFVGDTLAAVSELALEPYVVDLTGCLDRVLDASRRRRFLRWLRELEAGVATGIVSVDDAVARCARVRGRT